MLLPVVSIFYIGGLVQPTQLVKRIFASNEELGADGLSGKLGSDWSGFIDRLPALALTFSSTERGSSGDGSRPPLMVTNAEVELLHGKIEVSESGRTIDVNEIKNSLNSCSSHSAG